MYVYLYYYIHVPSYLYKQFILKFKQRTCIYIYSLLNNLNIIYSREISWIMLKSSDIHLCNKW